jgi:hypothetical protein
MAGSLMPLLDPQHYAHMMQQLSRLFVSGRQPAVNGLKLRCRYAYVQAAVRVGQLDMVVEELDAFVKECS